MRENCTYGSMRGIRRKTAKHVLRVAEDRAGVPHGASRSTLHPRTLLEPSIAGFPENDEEEMYHLTNWRYQDSKEKK